MDPDVINEWRTFAAWQNTPELLPRTFPGAALYRAQVPGIGEMLVLSRSPKFLDERMAWLGFPAVSVVELQPAWVKAAASAPVGPRLREAIKAKEDDRLERLRALGNEKEPAHDCDRRREILAARAEIKRLAGHDQIPIALAISRHAVR